MSDEAGRDTASAAGAPLLANEEANRLRISELLREKKVLIDTIARLRVEIAQLKASLVR